MSLTPEQTAVMEALERMRAEVGVDALLATWNPQERSIEAYGRG